MNSDEQRKRRFRITPVIWAALFQGALALLMAPTSFAALVLVVIFGTLHISCLCVASSFRIDDWKIAWTIIWLSLPTIYFASLVIR